MSSLSRRQVERFVVANDIRARLTTPRGLSRAGLLTFGITLTVLLGASALTLQRFSRQSVAADSVEHTYRVLLALDGLVREMEEAESEERAYLITLEPEYLPDYRRAAAKVPEMIA